MSTMWIPRMLLAKLSRKTFRPLQQPRQPWNSNQTTPNEVFNWGVGPGAFAVKEAQRHETMQLPLFDWKTRKNKTISSQTQRVFLYTDATHPRRPTNLIKTRLTARGRASLSSREGECRSPSTGFASLRGRQPSWTLQKRAQPFARFISMGVGTSGHIARRS